MTKLGVIVGGTRYSEPQTSEVKHCFDLLDLDAKETEPSRIALDFLAHGFALHPKRRHEAALLEKRGPGGAYVDLTDLRVIRAITPMPGHHFYGHGAFSREGDVLFVIETDLATHEGVVSIRDPLDFKLIDTFPTFGASPHDCMLIEDGKTLAVTNGGGPVGSDATPCVTFIDVASCALVEKLAVDDPQINTGHLAVGPGRELAVVSAPRDGLPASTSVGGVSLRARGGPMRYAREPRRIVERMLGESLSICMHPRVRVALATHPLGHMITLWNLDEGALFAMLELPHPRGVTLTLDGRCFAISFGPAASLLLLEMNPLRPVGGHEPGTRRFGGSHVYTWERPSRRPGTMPVPPTESPSHA